MQIMLTKGFLPDTAVINDGRECDSRPIVAKSLNAARDETCGVALSKYNLNYVFEGREENDNEPNSVPQHDTHLNDMPSEWIQDQGGYGAAVANAIAYAVRILRRQKGLSDFPPSRFFIYYFGRGIQGLPKDKDSGMYISSGLRAVQQYSVCSEDTWAYDDKKIFAAPTEYAVSAARSHERFTWSRVEQDETALKALIRKGCPVIFGFTVFESFMSAETASTGVISVPDYSSERQNGGHVAVLTGYDDRTRVFILANSFSRDWGDGGKGYIPYEYILNMRYARDFYTLGVV